MDSAWVVIARRHSGGNMSVEGAVMVLLILAIIVFVALYFSKEQRIKREIAAAQRWAIAELPESTLGRIVGAAKPIGEPLTSPLGGRKCIYYLAEVRTAGKHSKLVVREERSMPCVIEDDSGRAIVDVEGAEMALGQDSVTSAGPFDDAPEHVRSFLASNNPSATGPVLHRTLVYREMTISVDETIAVLGAGVREPDPDAPPTDAYRGAPAMRLRLTSTPRWKLRISDHHSTLSTAP